MFFDARKDGDGELSADVCIVGGGAAGITIANQFVDTNASVILLESGGDAMDKETERLNSNATVSGHNYPLHRSRLRFFGGATNHWAGFCYPFSDFDFEKRDDVPVSGWPITLRDVAPYYEKAMKIALFRTEVPNWSPEHWERNLDTQAWPIETSDLEMRMTFIAPPSPAAGTRTFAQYREPIDRARNIRVFQYANVTELVPNEASTAIERVVVKTIAGKSFTVRARVFIVATGGIENARLLLASRSRKPSGVGNENDQVGRYFTDHIVIHQEFLRNTDIPHDRRIGLNILDSRTAVLSHYLVGRDALRREKMDSVFLRLSPENQFVPGYVQTTSDILSGRFENVSSDDLQVAMQNVGAVSKHLAKRAYCELDEARYNIIIRAEPSLDPHSRVTIDKKADAIGMPIANLHWSIPDTAKHSIYRSMEIFAQEAGRTGLGRARLTFDPKAELPPFPELDVGYHHTCTTRMSADPKQGVVDANCRVHGVENLFIAGSSVFGTAGSGSPTMMLTALALRLSDHLKQVLA